MERDGYIVKIKESNGGDETVEWIVGPRGKVEISDTGVRGMVREVYGGTDPVELERRLQRSLGVEEVAPPAGGQDSARRRVGRRRDDAEEDDDEGGGEDQSEEEE